MKILNERVRMSQRKSHSRKLKKQFITRWSPRSFMHKDVEIADLEALFEAARWAPSCFNEQPWMFVYAKKQDDLKRMQSILVDSNQVWANHAPVLIAVFARRNFNSTGQENEWAAYDTGAAWMSLCLQAHAMGMICHAMGGFKANEIYDVLNVDQEKYQAICVVAVGYQGEKENLPENLREKEGPSQRQPVEAFTFEGKF